MEKVTNLSNFYYVPLEEGAGTKAFEGLAPGTFIEMWGRKVTFRDEDLIGIANKTKVALDAKRVKEGDDFAGLPIEGAGHYSGGAVGWIKSVKLSDNGKRIICYPEWNDEGRRILETAERRYFSPTVADLNEENEYNGGNRIVIGGTLTNWPAIRDDDDLPMMNPVALSDGRFTFAPKKEKGDEESLSIKSVLTQLVDLLRPHQLQTGQIDQQEIKPKAEGDTDMEKVNVKELLESMSAEDKAEFITALALETDGEVTSQVDEQIKTALENMDSRTAEIVGERVEMELLKRETVSFAKDLVGGGEIGLGLPTKGEKLEKFLLSLDGKQLVEARDIFSEIQSTGLVDFQEKGSKNPPKGGKEELSAEMKAVIRGELSRGITLERFFEINDDLGSMEKYDLKEFQPEVKKEEEKKD